MKDIIRLLPEQLANQIAAGEVVQRPASVVKELLENSVDAGATRIRLTIKDGGKSLIQVLDNGCGMSETDARMAFERHATSKIRSVEDLFRIGTLGFRGEALASIAAVAQTELRTKRLGDETGILVCVDGGTLSKHEAVAAQEGSCISVRNLFYNVPARRNFLKSNSIELRHITEEFIRVALGNPELGFVLVNEDEEIHHLRPGTLRQRIISLFGKRYNEGLIPVEEKTDILTVQGFLGRPDFARKTRGEQYFFANGRFIKNAYLNHAVMTAYEQLLPPECYPLYVLRLQLDPSRMDINVHPTKTEIKFEDEKSTYAILRTAIRKSLTQHHIAPALDFEPDNSFSFSSYQGDTGNQVRVSSSPASGNPAYTGIAPLGGKSHARPEDWLALYDSLRQTAEPVPEEDSEPDNDRRSQLFGGAMGTEKPVLQLHGKYLITSLRSGLMIINQSLAHERILFERFVAHIEGQAVLTQKLLFPEVMELSGKDSAVMREILPEITRLGYEIEEFGKTSFLLSGIPADETAGSDHRALLERMLEGFKESGGASLPTGERVARAMAKVSAVRTGQPLGSEEMHRLIDELFACGTPYFSPEGRPTLITLSTEELDKKFRN